MKIIQNIEELLAIERKDDVVLVDDIDGRNRSIEKLLSVFNGTIDGNGHTISNLLIEPDIWGDEQKVALFHHLTRATVKNVSFRNITFKLNKGVYSPSIAALAADVSDSIVDNVNMVVYTSFRDSIPMLYETTGCKIYNINIICNDINAKPILYKEGSST